jgi:pescadillo protein
VYYSSRNVDSNHLIDRCCTRPGECLVEPNNLESGIHKMGRLKQKGKAGAAKAYVTRTAAIKKLQCTLADFRRLCILKGMSHIFDSREAVHSERIPTGIFPREPRSRKRANKGSSAPTSFYYTKDIAYLAHEPVLTKLRDHKAFAKKLAKALRKSEWSSAKSLEENKPVYRLDHIIKER